jgi:hypothetical protein
MKLRVVAVAVALVFGFAHPAFPGALPGAPPGFTLSASSSVGGDLLQLSPTLIANPDGSYSASGESTAPSFSLLFDFTLNPDPSVSGSFTLVNLSGATQTFSVSATLGVLSIAAPTRIGGSYGTTTYTDLNGNSSVTLATADLNPFYQAQIDGVGVHNLGSFNNTAFGGPGVFGTISPELFGVPIPSLAGPGVSASIGVSFPGFTLTPGDSVQVPFEFVVVPEPTFAALFAMGLAVILCTFAQERAFSRRKLSGRIPPTGG